MCLRRHAQPRLERTRLDEAAARELARDIRETCAVPPNHHRLQYEHAVCSGVLKSGKLIFQTSLKSYHARCELTQIYRVPKCYVLVKFALSMSELVARREYTDVFVCECARCAENRAESQAVEDAYLTAARAEYERRGVDPRLRLDGALYSECSACPANDEVECEVCTAAHDAGYAAFEVADDARAAARAARDRELAERFAPQPAPPAGHIRYHKGFSVHPIGTGFDHDTPLRRARRGPPRACTLHPFVRTAIERAILKTARVSTSIGDHFRRIALDAVIYGKAITLARKKIRELPWFDVSEVTDFSEHSETSYDPDGAHEPPRDNSSDSEGTYTLPWYAATFGSTNSSIFSM